MRPSIYEVREKSLTFVRFGCDLGAGLKILDGTELSNQGSCLRPNERESLHEGQSKERGAQCLTRWPSGVSPARLLRDTRLHPRRGQASSLQQVSLLLSQLALATGFQRNGPRPGSQSLIRAYSGLNPTLFSDSPPDQPKSRPRLVLHQVLSSLVFCSCCKVVRGLGSAGFVRVFGLLVGFTAGGFALFESFGAMAKPGAAQATV